MIKRRLSTLAVATVGALTAAVQFSSPGTSSAQDVPPPPPATGRPHALPPGPLGERPPAPETGRPVDPKAAPLAVKTANDALAGLTAGQVWSRTAPRGEQEVQATLVFNGKDVARLDFDPATGLLRARGEGRPIPPAPPVGPGAPGAPVPPPSLDASKPAPPKPDANAPASGAAVPASPIPDANASTVVAPANLDSIKANLAGIVKGLSIGQEAEIMPREGFWKVPIISGNRVVGELHLSADGTQIVEDFMAARDAAIFAR